MKILGINSSPRKGHSQTLQLVKGVLDGASQAGAQVEFIDLCDLNIEYCNACGVCFAKGSCVKDDDFKDLFTKILDCDGLVIGSPNYFSTVTAQLKTLLDRMADVVHCQMLLGKYACAVATAGGPAYDEVLDYLKKIMVGFGAHYVGGVGAAPTIPGSMDEARLKSKALGIELVKAIESHKTYPDQEPAHQERRNRFGALVKMNKDIWPHEYEYWKEKGWL